MQKSLKYKETTFTINPYWVDPIVDFNTLSDRPLAIICPGGAFKFLSDRESQPIAFKFNSIGMHAIVLNYSLISEEKNVFPIALQELATTLNWVYSQRNERHIDVQKVVLIGFSAGGNVVANYNSLMMNPSQREKIFPNNILIEPSSNILSYPVVDLTIGWPKTNNARNEITSEQVYWRAEKTLTKMGKPTFIWQTVTDELVPVQNSLLYASRMIELGIKCELHLFGSGNHGLSLATYVTQDKGYASQVSENDAIWWDLMTNWLKLQNILPNK
ncbi:alpha/beta hydrolase [Companilactobacillus sp. FL22-1]|uniref:alpha/beta hydrolase n=1 Tax=Companilactobacillus sp. FL22-1 TaxID=3373892 RepID=UPI003754E3B9